LDEVERDFMFFILLILLQVVVIR